MKAGPLNLTVVKVVTKEHGETFAAKWYRGDIAEACDATGIIEWPEDGDGVREAEAEERALELTKEICERVFQAVRGVVAETFVRVAGEVLAAREPSDRTKSAAHLGRKLGS